MFYDLFVAGGPPDSHVLLIRKFQKAVWQVSLPKIHLEKNTKKHQTTIRCIGVVCLGPIRFSFTKKSGLVHQQTSQQQTALPHHQVPTNVSFGAEHGLQGKQTVFVGCRICWLRFRFQISCWKKKSTSNFIEKNRIRWMFTIFVAGEWCFTQKKAEYHLIFFYLEAVLEVCWSNPSNPGFETGLDRHHCNC